MEGEGEVRVVHFWVDYGVREGGGMSAAAAVLDAVEGEEAFP